MLLHVLKQIRNMLTKKQPVRRQAPLIIVLGSTGSGKTKLSLELAQKFGGEIIGADSMQVWQPRLSVTGLGKQLKVVCCRFTRGWI